MELKSNIIILSASFGQGHNSVAKAIKKQIIDINYGYEVEIVDILDLFDPLGRKIAISIYKILTKRFPGIYNFFYNLKGNFKNNIMDLILYFIYYKKVKKYIIKKNSSIFISTFPWCSGFISLIKDREDINTPLVTVVTDVVASWEWIHKGTDIYFLPSKEIRHKYILKGVEKDKLKVTGIPVKEEFYYDTYKKTRDTKQILIMDSEMKKVCLNDKLLDELGKMEDVKVIIVTGSNHQLYDKLSKKNKYKNIEIIGFTNEISKLMDESDLIITKPGGVTLFESINKCVPLILTKSKVGQEMANVEFIMNLGIGIVVDDIDDGEKLLNIINNVLYDKEKFQEIVTNMETLKNDLNSKNIGQYSLELLYR